MESLLPELVVRVAKYLSPRDLAVSCAVSIGWRDIFGTNEVWKPLCDVEIEEYLRTTPCLVEPAFPESIDQYSTLKPLSQWRLAFMREQHLWSNWKKGNCKTVEQKMTGGTIISLGQFITNDFVVSFKTRSVELWDVRSLQPVLVNSLSLDFDLEKESPPIVFENGLVVLKNHESILMILRVNVVKGTISVKYQIFLNKLSQTPELVPCRGIKGLDPYLDLLRIIIVKGRFCIGYFWLDPDKDSFYVWDLKTGEKLIEESCSIAPAELGEGSFSPLSISDGLCIVGSRTCDDILVLVPTPSDMSVSVIDSQTYSLLCRVYDVQNLRFFPFSKSFLVNMDMITDDDVPAAITKDFIAVLADFNFSIRPNGGKAVRIFNYRTDQQLYLFDAVLQVQALADACFIFTYEKYLPVEFLSKPVDWRLCSVSCLSGHVVKDVTGLAVDDFKAFGNRFVEAAHSSGDSEVWGINKFSWFKTPVKFAVSCDPDLLQHPPEVVKSYVKEVNKVCTKLITQKSVEEMEVLQIFHFW